MKIIGNNQISLITKQNLTSSTQILQRYKANMNIYSSYKLKHNYRQVSNMRRTLAGYKIVDHSDVVGASPIGAAPTTSSFST